MEYEIGQAQVYLHRSTTRCPVLNMLTETQTKSLVSGLAAARLLGWPQLFTS